MCDSSRVALTCSSNGPEETTRETTTRGSARQIPFLSEGKAGTRYLRSDSRDIGTVQMQTMKSVAKVSVVLTDYHALLFRLGSQAPLAHSARPSSSGISI